MSSEIVMKVELRPCLVGGEKGLFHKWVEKENLAFIEKKFVVGLVELADGSVGEFTPYQIKFCDNKIDEYAFHIRGAKCN